jgi:hypothetical protein
VVDNLSPVPESKNRRRTAPPPAASKPAAKGPSPLWVQTLMFALIGVGVFVIVANYFEILPGEPNNWYLLLGIGYVTAGFIAATAVR